MQGGSLVRTCTIIITTIHVVDSQYYEQSQSNTGTPGRSLWTLFPTNSFPAIETQNSILVATYRYSYGDKGLAGVDGADIETTPFKNIIFRADFETKSRLSCLKPNCTDSTCKRRRCTQTQMHKKCKLHV